MSATYSVLVICDGLRADLLNPLYTPNIWHFGKNATHYVNHHSVFPSVTRVCSSSIATGCYPARHGLMGNSVALDEGAGLVVADVGKPEFVERMRAVHGRTLRVPTLAQHLADNGGSVVFSNVSPGAAYFQDPDGYGFVYHRAGSFGPGRTPLAAPDHRPVSSDAAGDIAMTERFCTEVLRQRRPAHAVLWLNDPDHTGHNAPLGSPDYLDALAIADQNVGQVIATLHELDPHFEETLLLIGSDHGMETERRIIPLGDYLIAAGLKEGKESHEVVVAANGSAALIYLAPAALNRCQPLVEYLEAQDWVEAVYADEALSQVHHQAVEGLVIAVNMRHDGDALNEYGVAGYSDIAANSVEEIKPDRFGTHGGLGTFEQRPFLMVRGPGYAADTRVEAATALVDIAPTILRHHGIEGVAMDGQPLPTV